MENHCQTSDEIRFKVKEDTKLVLEAFLKHSLSTGADSTVGHVGRTYHDPKKFAHRSLKERVPDAPLKWSKRSPERRELREKGEKRQSLKRHEGKPEANLSGSSLREEISRVEEKKHGLGTSIKQLLRQSKKGSTASKSHESIDGQLEDLGRASGKADSLRRQKDLPSFQASTQPEALEAAGQKPADERVAADGYPGPGARRKQGHTFSFKNLLKKKSTHKGQEYQRDREQSPPSQRPSSLPVTPCYPQDAPEVTGLKGEADDPEFYLMAAKKLDKLIKQQKLKSPETPNGLFHAGSKENIQTENNNLPAEDSAQTKEEIIHKLVALLKEQAAVINEQISENPVLRNTLNRMSYRSFTRLAEAFTSQADKTENRAEAAVSPKLIKIALTMELTRKVAGFSNHAVHTLMGYSLQYMDMFIPWLQQQGGWENIILQEDIPDFQID